MLIVSVFLVLFTLTSVSVMAVGLEYYEIDAEIQEDLMVKNRVTLQFDSPVSHLDYTFDSEIYGLTSTADFNWVNCDLDVRDGKSYISCDFMGMTSEKKTLTLEFSSRKGVKPVNDKYKYTSEYGISLPVDRFFISVKLPSNGRLAEEIANESYFPTDGDIYTDGRSIIVYWDRAELVEGDSVEFSILYTIPLMLS